MRGLHGVVMVGYWLESRYFKIERWMKGAREKDEKEAADGKGW